MCITLDMLPLWDAIPKIESGWQKAGGEPFQVSPAAGVDSQDEEFRGSVDVQGVKASLKLSQPAGLCFE